VYRSLADADATVAEEFLVRSEEERQAAQLRYGDAIEQARASLAHAATQASEDGLSTERIAAITEQLPVYTEITAWWWPCCGAKLASTGRSQGSA
jgi:hypothetical protein